MNEYIIVQMKDLPENIIKDLTTLTIRFDQDDIKSFSQCTTDQNKFKFDIPIVCDMEHKIAHVYADVKNFIVRVFVDDQEISLKQLMYFYSEAYEF